MVIQLNVAIKVTLSRSPYGEVSLHGLQSLGNTMLTHNAQENDVKAEVVGLQVHDGDGDAKAHDEEHDEHRKAGIEHFEGYP